MPNVKLMNERLASHMARVNGKMMDREFDRIRDLAAAGKVSQATATYMRQSASIRLAYLANARTA